MKGKGNVVDITRARSDRASRFEGYEKLLAGLRECLADLRERCAYDAFNLAMAGPWREWDERQPDGAELELDEDALRQCGDPMVARLLDLGEHIEGIIGEIDSPKRTNA